MAMPHRPWQYLAATALLGLAACGDLEVANPNAPERERAFSDPATIVASAAGTMKTWANTRWAYSPTLTLSAMGDNVTASWNNFNMRLYSSYGIDCADRCGWVNAAGVPQGIQVEEYWYGMYSMLSSANDALFAIRKSANPPDLGSRKDAVEAIAQLAQAMAHAFIALNYDQGFIVLEDTDPTTLELSTRKEMRDAALGMFDKAAQLATGKSFTTDPTWFGLPGPVYTASQLAQIAYTAKAELLALYPRNAAENASQVNWAEVVSAASKGISSGTPFDFMGYADENNTWFSGFHAWANDYTTAKVDTRVARLLAVNQRDSFPGGNGDPLPTESMWGVVDKRIGDGCFGDVDDYLGYGECAATANSGTDFMYSPIAIFIAGRGAQHQSYIGAIREHCLTFISGPACPAANYFGPLPLYRRHYNDLLWAEGLIRSNGNLGQAADLINRSRVGRGGLPQLTGANTKDELLKALLYEQDVELFNHGSITFYNRRRVSGTTPTGVRPCPSQVGTLGCGNLAAPEGPYVLNTLRWATPREMPVPAKDLQLLRAEIYTFGGANNPSSSQPVAPADPQVRSVRDIWAEMEKSMKPSRFGRRTRN